MAELKAQAKLGKSDDKNGLIELAGQLAAEFLAGSTRKRAALIIYEPLRVTTEKDGIEKVTIEILRAESFLEQDMAEGEKFLRRALEHRSGETTLPLELEDDINEAFGEMKEPDSAKDPDNPDDPGNPKDRKGGPRK
jgi:hypothetical protein